MKAILIGATGLVGNALLEQMINDARFSSVEIFVRRSTGKSHPKLKEHIIDFEKTESIKSLVNGDVLFSALGTTIKTAGVKSNNTGSIITINMSLQEWRQRILFRFTFLYQQPERMNTPVCFITK